MTIHTLIQNLVMNSKIVLKANINLKNTTTLLPTETYHNLV